MDLHDSLRGIARSWRLGDLKSVYSSGAGSIAIALIAATAASLIFRLAQRNQITPDELDRTSTPEGQAAKLKDVAPAVT